MGQEKPVPGEVVAIKPCDEEMRKPTTGSEVRMQCQDKSIEHGVGFNHLNVEYRVPTDPKMAAIAALCKSGVLTKCEPHVVPKQPTTEREK